MVYEFALLVRALRRDSESTVLKPECYIRSIGKTEAVRRTFHCSVIFSFGSLRETGFFFYPTLYLYVSMPSSRLPVDTNCWQHRWRSPFLDGPSRVDLVYAEWVRCHRGFFSRRVIFGSSIPWDHVDIGYGTSSHGSSSNRLHQWGAGFADHIRGSK